MGVVGSKDESGKVILGSLPPGFLDYEGRDLRDKLDECLGKSMWLFTAGGLIITLPICYRYKTERPLFAAALTCPVLDMMYGTVRCEPEKQAYLQHYKRLEAKYAAALLHGREAGAPPAPDARPMTEGGQIGRQEGIGQDGAG